MSIYCWPCASCPLSWYNRNNPTDFRPNALVIFRAHQRPLSSGKVLVRFAKSNPIVRPCIKVGGYPNTGREQDKWCNTVQTCGHTVAEIKLIAAHVT
ncbi:hypothetical protein CEXT_345911 [Caerostris extrusa]|uniref:Uncharacterized protein n=1 Tax=Caerostris extrusa TaxID=172846 RepID=A0AAV4TF57_CAEEX|nr:hypothetical protein CEXT_345911 [Caerostris extrusa]